MSISLDEDYNTERGLGIESVERKKKKTNKRYINPICRSVSYRIEEGSGEVSLTWRYHQFVSG